MNWLVVIASVAGTLIALGTIWRYGSTAVRGVWRWISGPYRIAAIEERLMAVEDAQVVVERIIRIEKAALTLAEDLKAGLAASAEAHAVLRADVAIVNSNVAGLRGEVKGLVAGLGLDRPEMPKAQFVSATSPILPTVSSGLVP